MSIIDLCETIPRRARVGSEPHRTIGQLTNVQHNYYKCISEPIERARERARTITRT